MLCTFIMLFNRMKCLGITYAAGKPKCQTEKDTFTLSSAIRKLILRMTNNNPSKYTYWYLRRGGEGRSFRTGNPSIH